MQSILYRALLVLTILALLGGCRPAAPEIGAPSPTPGQVTEAAATPPPAASDTPAATPTQPGLQISDPGSPLPPQVVEQYPAPGQELAGGKALQLVFDQPMDTEQTAAALEVTDGQGRPVAGRVTWMTEDTLSFQPERRLESGILYFATLGIGARSARGAALFEPLTWKAYGLSSFKRWVGVIHSPSESSLQRKLKESIPPPSDTAASVDGWSIGCRKRT
ncbi:MAG: Ig-like domain-containing protein [Chloroflexota bacterium]